MKDLEGLAEFCAVVENGGFTRAGEAIGMSAAFISRRVASLAARIGARLLHRTTRQVNLTDIGAQYYERAKSILEDIEALSADMSEQQELVKGTIRVTAGGAFGETWVKDVIVDFAAHYPDIEIELLMTDRQVDLVAERFDLAIRHGTPSDPDLIMRRISTRRMIVCGAPEYFAEKSIPQVPEDLLHLDGLRSKGLKWLFSTNGNDPYEIRPPARLWSNSGYVLARAAEQGLGVARLADAYVESALETGRLVRVLEDYEVPTQDIVLCYPSKDYLPFRVRKLIEFLAARNHVPGPE